jgi:sortase (surface protein transpeptidase)
MLGLGLRGSDRPLPGPAPSPAAVRAAINTPRVVTALSTVRSVPLTLKIPAIDVSVPLGSLGLNSDGTVQVPTTAQQAGWFNLGPTPGQIGSAVVLGHVDSYLGPGVFFELRTLAPGDQVVVDLSDGVTASFTVNAKGQFPAQRVYGSHGSSALQLVTCGGVFDHQTGSYLSNIVVYTSLTSVTPAIVPAAPERSSSAP